MSSKSNNLIRARCRLLQRQPWYGTFASLMDWRKSNTIPTMGVRAKQGGRVECVWNPYFCSLLTVDELSAVVMHEIDHIIRLHIVRGSKSHQIWNIAADMLVNGERNRPKISNLPVIPILNDNSEVIDKRSCVYFPDANTNDRPDVNSTTEEVYNWLLKRKNECKTCNGSGIVQKDQSGQGQGQQDDEGDGQGNQEESKNDSQQQSCCGHGHQPCPDCSGKWGVMIDDHSLWSSSEVGKDELRQVVKDMVERSNSNAPGQIPGHLAEAIENLKDPVINWKHKLKMFTGRCLGGRRKTYSRRNRRNDRFGIKGNSNHASVPLTVLVDTSGSVSSKLIQQFFAEIESMSHQFKITLVQFDHAIQDVRTYHRGDWRQIEVHGRGGTSFDVAIEGIKERKLVGACNLVLTDGYASFPPEEKFPVMWVINTDVIPPWGEHLKIDCDE